MRRRQVHQILVGAGAGDAITSMARQVRDALAPQHESSIYAHFIAPELAGEIRPLHSLGAARHDDIIVYHVSYGAPEVTSTLLHRPERLVLAYHNITPPIFFVEHEPQFAAGLQWGRYELSLLRDRTVLAIADSSFNAAELVHEGFGHVEVVPAGLTPSRLRHTAPDPALARRLREQFPGGYVLSVSQVLPHKRFEKIIGAMHLVQWVHELGLGLVVVGAHRMPNYLAALQSYGRSLRVDRMWFADAVSDAQLATFFRMASMHVTASAHEGLALPPLEAMSFGVPALAIAAGAIEETLADAGLLLPSDAGSVMLGEAIAELHHNEALRLELIRRGEARVAAIESTDPVTRFVELLEGLD